MSGIEILVVLAIAALSAYIASRKGRNVYAWAFSSIVTGIVSPIVLLMRPHVDKLEKSDTWVCIGLHFLVIALGVAIAVVLISAASAGMIL